MKLWTYRHGPRGATSSDGTLRTIRKAQGLTVRQVAERASLDPTHYSRIERGLNTPNIDTMARIAAVLGLHELAKLLKPFLRSDR